jgi:succinate dehydrogenase / fumarate reductase cytochrome b subunit
MIFSGLAILVFVPWHLIGMKWGTHYEALADPEVRDLHRLMTEYFRDPLHAFAYMGFMLLLGFHLWHGFASGFESLGCRHRSWVMKLGHVLAVLVAGAFFIIPLIIFIKGVGK